MTQLDTFQSFSTPRGVNGVGGILTPFCPFRSETGSNSTGDWTLTLDDGSKKLFPLRDLKYLKNEGRFIWGPLRTDVTDQLTREQMETFDCFKWEEFLALRSDQHQRDQGREPQPNGPTTTTEVLARQSPFEWIENTVNGVADAVTPEGASDTTRGVVKIAIAGGAVWLTWKAWKALT